jgi:hypothetical protein
MRGSNLEYCISALKSVSVVQFLLVTEFRKLSPFYTLVIASAIEPARVFSTNSLVVLGENPNFIADSIQRRVISKT